ncbi:DUF4065 domain-containing protein [Paenibacillus sp. Lou8.1]|uniref:Panacea domain-containing protein n=1 Tax=Paenibacillus sp. Lou8.1 TaxID=2962041 RepID=UPI0020B70B54|nr:type II toxin-antitoxin system antitoxin SocA domain-containing protein [Paenibacillus sp. Lou8.1]MCP3807110.1 DUF4065 domain-containing protein [Paenibacillus sp. Lou8.1]
MAKIFDVADFFIQKSHSIDMPITHLKLQKLCYYAQAWSLVLNNNNRLFNGEFQAWVHGPVNPELFRKYKDYGWDPIDCTYNEPALDKSEKRIMTEVWGVYGSYDAKFLEALTHNEEPWKEARKGLPDDAYSKQTINEDTMRRYYSDLLKKS